MASMFFILIFLICNFNWSVSEQNSLIDTTTTATTKSLTSSTLTLTTLSSTTTNPENFQCPNRRKAVYPHSVLCTDFWFCIRGASIRGRCNPKTMFDITTHRCKIESESNCAENACPYDISTPYFEKSTPVGSRLSCPAITGNYPIDGDSSRYWNCIGGYGKLLTCSNGQKFDVHFRKCSANANTVSDVDITGLCADQDLPRNLRHPRLCDRFIQCCERKAYIKYCPLGTRYDTVNGFCILPRLAVCKQT